MTPKTKERIFRECRKRLLKQIAEGIKERRSEWLECADLVRPSKFYIRDLTDDNDPNWLEGVRLAGVAMDAVLKELRKAAR